MKRDQIEQNIYLEYMCKILSFSCVKLVVGCLCGKTKDVWTHPIYERSTTLRAKHFSLEYEPKPQKHTSAMCVRSVCVRVCEHIS